MCAGIFTLKSCDLSITQINPISCLSFSFFFPFFPFICPFNYLVTRTRMVARFVDVLSSEHIQHDISVSKLRMHMLNLSIHVNFFHDWFLFLFSPHIGYISITKPKLTWKISVVYQRGELHSQYCNCVCVLN